MDIEEYYFNTKDQKSRKLALTSKRVENAWRRRERARKGAREGVSKQIRTAGGWNADRINDFCEDVLMDGGMMDTTTTSYSKSRYPLDGEISLKKEKRWMMYDEIRKAAMHHANDTEMPDVVIIERAGKSGFKRTGKPDITSATYSVTTPVAHPLKRGPSETRVVVDSFGRSHYSSEASLRDEIKKVSERSQNRAEVTYIFRSPCHPSRHLADKMKHTYGKMPNARPNIYKEELDAYYNGGLWENILCLADDDETDSGNEDFAGEMEQPKPLIVNLEKEITTALSKRKCHSKTPKARKQNAEVEFPTKKGKAISLPLSERTGDVHVHNQLTRNTTVSSTSEETLHEFMARHEIVRSEGISIANATPLSFTADLRPPHSNDVKDGFCHLIFETNYDPDMLEVTNSGQPHCKVEVTLCSSDEKIAGKISESLPVLLRTLSENDAPSIEQIVSTVRLSVSESWSGQVNAHQKVGTDNPEIKGTRSFNICEDLAKKMGIRSSSYSNVDNLRHSVTSSKSEPDEDYDFEMVTDISKTAEECNSCHRLFGNGENAGMAIRDCRHWFCKKCWGNHLLQSEEFIGKCMEPGCTSTMNFAMQLVLGSYQNVPSHRRNCGRLGDEFAYLCPNSSCCKVVTTTFSFGEPSILTCSCGTVWCGKCGKEPHWPASCAAAKIQSLEYIAMSLKSSSSSARYMKECPQCQRTIERKSAITSAHICNYSCPHCSYYFYCWRCMGTCINDFEGRMQCDRRQFRWYKNRPCKRDEVPETKVLSLPGFSSDVNTPSQVYESIFNIMKSLRSYDFENEVRRRASSYFEESRNGEMMTIVTDLLFARNQICFFTVWIIAEMRYGKLKSSSKRKYIQGILKKLESARDAMDWLLISRDYACNDGVFPEAYNLNVSNANRLLKLVIHAFK